MVIGFEMDKSGQLEVVECRGKWRAMASDVSAVVLCALGALVKDKIKVKTRH
jgi:hypothetical protein